nr:outer membrane protein assembly factor BamA [Roseovarius salinarum]
MTNTNGGGASRSPRARARAASLGTVFTVLFSLVFLALAGSAEAQNYRFTSVSIEGNQRVEPETILSYAGIARGETVSAGELNDAYQRILGSGLFEEVEVDPQGSRLVIRVKEYPTVNRIRFEGNRRLKDEDLEGVISSSPRQVFNPDQAERDAAAITESYVQNGRVAAKVTPRIIRRSDNRVDLVFEIFEGKNIEVQRIGFVGNRAFSDRRLRRVLESKQAGLLRAIIAKDTFVADRIEFDKQVLNDFYQSRGYVDFRVTGVNAELTRERDGYFITFNIQEGQQFTFGEITTVSEHEGADPEAYQDVLKIRSGVVYSPTLVENSIARMERLAVKNGLDFLRVEPRITRNDRELTLDVEFALVRGPRVFVERIDIEGNTTTLDRVIRRQFETVEGDPFNPRAIRQAAERIRALGYFSKAEVDAREGSRPDQVVIDVDVEETTTGSFSFGGSYSSSRGIGLTASLRERNFLGRGQQAGLSFSLTDQTANYSLDFTEPAFLGRDVAFGLNLGFQETDSDFSAYDTTTGTFRPSLTFPTGERTRLGVFYNFRYNDMDNYTGTSGILAAEVAQGSRTSSALGYTYNYDSRTTGLDPNSGVLVEVQQEFAGLGGDNEFIRTTGRAVAQTKVWHEEVTLRAVFESGAINFGSGQNSRATTRFNSQVMRGFDPNGLGPAEINAGNVEHLGGNFYSVLKLETEFPLGLPEEYGLTGGAFYDIGGIWDVDTTNATGAVVSEGFNARHVIGVSLLWESAFGPLRFNFSHPIEKEPTDVTQGFDLTVSTDF